MTRADATVKPIAVVVGVGPANGAALARRFARAGYRVAMLSRTVESTQALAKDISGSAAYACDVGDPRSIAAAFAQIRADLGEVDALIYNAGSGVFAGFEDIVPSSSSRPGGSTRWARSSARRKSSPG